MLAAVFGGIFIGIGVGLIIRGRSSTGSTSVVGEIVALRTKYRASEVLLFIDALIMLSSMLVFDEMNQSLYSMFSVYVTSRTRITSYNVCYTKLLRADALPAAAAGRKGV